MVAFHLAFIVFVSLGALAVLRWPRLAWLHVPCVLWGAFVELAGRICPLTPLENSLRAKAGLAGYAGGFIENYVIPVVYPENLTRAVQVGAGLLVLAINLAAYGYLWRVRQAGPSRPREGASGAGRASPHQSRASGGEPE